MRGFSILLVVLHHIGLRIRLQKGVLGAYLPKRLLDAVIFNGYEAVFIFFVISGFLIASNTLARRGSLGAVDARAFYIRRAARIVPCLVVLVIILSILHLAGVHNYVISRPGQSLPRAIVAALGLHLNWYEGHTGYLPGNWDVLWSLSIEETFYLAFPLVCLVLRRNWILLNTMALLALSLPISHAAISGNEIWQEKAYLPGMAAIATGIFGAILAARFRVRRPRAVLALCGTGALGILAVLGFEDKLWHHMHDATLLLLTCSTLCLLLGFSWRASTGIPWTLPCTGWLRSFGRLSYEIYLSHMFVVFLVVGASKYFALSPWWGVLWYAPAVAFSWLLGWLVERYISAPGNRAIRQRLLA